MLFGIVSVKTERLKIFEGLWTTKLLSLMSLEAGINRTLLFKDWWWDVQIHLRNCCRPLEDPRWRDIRIEIWWWDGCVEDRQCW